MISTNLNNCDNVFKEVKIIEDQIDKILDQFTDEELVRIVDMSYENGGRL